MSWTKYSTRATTKDEVLKDRILKAAFHFKGIHTWKNPVSNAKKEEMVEFDFIDVAVLLGIKETCYGQEGDTPLTEEEITRFSKLLNKHNVIEEMFYPKKERRMADLATIVKSFREWEDRLVTGTVTQKEDGSVEIYLNAQTYMSLWRALTLQFPGTEIDVWEFQDYDDSRHYEFIHENFLVKYGTSTKIDEFFDRGKNEPADDEDYEESNDERVRRAFNLPSFREEKPLSTYERGMQHAYSGEYEEAIKLLSSLKGNSDALNNIGVCYERLKDYEKAYEYYQKANIPLSMDNLLTLYNSEKIPMNVEDYEAICDRLIDIDDYNGYLYKSKLYSKEHPDVPENKELAIRYAEQGYRLFPEEAEIVFNYAWCLCVYSETEEEKELSHKLFESLLVIDSKEDHELSSIAKSNYAWQFENSQGCEKDIERAIYWYIRAYEEGFVKAAQSLVYIYQLIDGYVNEENARFWQEQYDKNIGEEK